MAEQTNDIDVADVKDVKDVEDVKVEEQADPFSPRFYRLNQDLKLGRLGMEIAGARSVAELDEDFESKLESGTPVVDFDFVLDRVPEYTGLTKKEYLEAAAFQDFDLNDYVRRVGQSGEAVRKVLDDYTSLESMAMKTPEERVVLKKQQLLFPEKRKQIALLGESRIKSGQARAAKALEKKAASAVNAKVTAKPQTDIKIDLRQIKDLGRRQKEVARIVYDVGTDAGLSANQIQAILANGLAESKLNPYASNMSGEDSHGVWQFNRAGSGEGRGFTVAQLQDPEFQLKHAIKAIKTRGELKFFRDNPDADPKVLTEIFMKKFERPADQSDKKVAERQAYLKLAKRLYGDGEQLSTKQRKVRDIGDAEKSELIRKIHGSEADRYRFEAGDAAARAVAAESDPMFPQFKKEFQKYVDPKIADDPERARMLQKNLADHDTEDPIRSTFAEDAFESLFNQPYRYDIEKTAGRMGVSAAEFLRLAKDPSNKEFEIHNEIKRYNRKFVALYRTLNKAGSPIFLSYEFVDPNNWMQEDRPDEDSPYGKRLASAWVRNRVALMGLDGSGQPVYRLQDPTMEFINKIDPHLGFMVGGIEGALNRQDGQGFLDAIQEGTLRGIKDDRDFMKFALSTDLAKSSDGAAIALGLAGLGVDIFMFDPIFGAAKAFSKVRPFVQSKIAARKLPGLLGEMGSASTKFVDTSSAMQRVADAIEAGDLIKADELITQASKSAEVAQAAERTARKEAPKAMDNVDAADAALASDLAVELSGLTGKQADELSDLVGLTESGLSRDNVHASVLRLVARGESDSQLAAYPEFFDLTRKLDRLKTSLAQVQSGQLSGPNLSKLNREAIIPVTEKIISTVSQSKQSKKILLSSAYDDLIKYLISPEAAKDMAGSRAKFFARTNQALEKLDKVGDTNLSKLLQKRFTESQKIADDIIANQSSETNPEKLRKGLAQLSRTIGAQAESRAAAHAFLRQTIADESGLAIKPIIAAATSRFDDLGVRSLSLEGTALRRSLEREFPQLRESKQATIFAHMIDELYRSRAAKLGIPLEEVYRENLDVTRKVLLRTVADDVPDLAKASPAPTKAKAPAPEPAPTPPAPDLSTAATTPILRGIQFDELDEGLVRLTSREIEDVVAQQPKFELSAVTDGLRAKTVKQLNVQAKELGIRGVSKKKKADLVEIIAARLESDASLSTRFLDDNPAIKESVVALNQKLDAATQEVTRLQDSLAEAKMARFVKESQAGRNQLPTPEPATIDLPSSVPGQPPIKVPLVGYLEELLRKAESGQQDLIDETQKLRAKIASDAELNFLPGLVFGVRDDTLYVQSIELPQELRGRGIGNALYLAALRRAKNVGLNFSSDVNPSPQAERIYQRLRKQGVPIRVREIQDVDGKTLRRYQVKKSDLAKVDDALIDPRVAAKTPSPKPKDAPAPKPKDAPAEAKPVVDEVEPELLSGRNPLVVEAMSDGSSIIRAMRETFEFDDFVGAISQLVRKELSEPQMAEIVKWLRSKGVNVSHKGTQFVSDNPVEIEKANDLFAEAYSRFLRTDVSPTDGTQKGFDVIKDSLVSRYAGAKNAAVDGAELRISPEVDEVFKEILRAEAPRRSPIPNMLSVVRRYIVDNLPKMPRQKFFEQLSRQASRLGTPIEAKELDRIFAAAMKEGLASKKPLGEIEIKVPVMLNLRGPSSKASTTVTARDFADAMITFTRNLEQSKRTAKIPIKASYEAVNEQKVSGMIDQYITNSGSIAKFARFTFLGDDVLADLRMFDPDVRKDIMAGIRMVQQSIGDTVTLITDGDFANLVKYMAGEPSIQFKFGRYALSAGHDKMASVSKNLENALTAFKLGYPKLAAKLDAGLANPGELTQFLGDSKLASEYVSAFNQFVWNKAGSRFLHDVFISLGKKEGGSLVPEDFETLRQLMYHTNVLKIDGKTFKEAMEIGGKESGSSAQFSSLYQKFDQLFPFRANDPNTAPVANRISAVIAAHGQAHKQMTEWAKLGLVADANSKSAFTKWVQGEAIDDPQMLAQVQKMFKIYGFNPQFMEASNLYGLNFYVPQAARRKLALALEQSLDDSLRAAVASGDLLETLGRGARGAATTNAYAMAWTYRYVKTRMIRGHYLMKSRYFWMNTYDHFNQMALITGYRPALISSIRLMPQNFLANPLGQAVVTAASRLGAEKAPAVVAQQLQRAGDEGAKWAAGLMRASKWNGSVNAVLEAQPGFIMSNGVPIDNLLIRRIGIEEGIAGSFDTAELGTKIRFEGEMFLNNMQKEAKRQGIEVPLADLVKSIPKIAADIAESWSERERYGAMITLIEMGVEPRTAARLVIDALYDYAGSMSKMDRQWYMNIFFPFWAFQKNANRQLVDVVFSPEGAYRLGVMRRAYEKGPELLNELIYQDMVDPFGIDVESMSSTDRDLYGNLKNALATKYGSLYSIPDEDRRAIVMLLTGKTFLEEKGRRYLASKSGRYEDLKDEIRELRTREKVPFLERYYIPQPNKSQVPTYMDTQSKLFLPYRYNAASAFFEAQRQTTPDRQFTTILFPEQTYKASYKHMINGLRVFGAMGEELRKNGLRYLVEPDDGSDLFTVKQALEDFIQPERGLFVKDVMSLTSMSRNSVPLRLSTYFAKALSMADMEILAVDPKDDPVMKVLEYTDKKKAIAAGHTETTLPESPYILNGVVTPKKNYYLQAGMGRMIFENSPAGELNQLMLQLEQSPVEQHAGIRGEIQRLVRITGLARVSDVLPSKATQSASFRLQSESGGATAQEAKERTGIRYLGPLTGAFSRYKDKEATAGEPDGGSVEVKEDDVESEIRARLERLKAQDKGEMEIDL